MAEASFDELLRRRLGEIQQQGVNRSIFVKDQQAQQDAEAQGLASIQQSKIDALNSIRAQNKSQELLARTAPTYIESGGTGKWVTTGGSSGGGSVKIPKGSKGFESFMKAIQGQESGGDYSARNSSSGAMGKYQIMPGNIQGSGGWDKEALGRNVSVSQFMGSPQIQEAIARHKLQQYYNKYGAAGAAVAWYAGPGNAAKYVASGGKGFNKRQGNYPSVSSYAQQILRRMGYS
jgi:hypothetical protein